MNKKNKGDIILSFAPFFQIAVLMLQEFLVASHIVEHESFRNVSIVLSAIPMIPAIYIFIKRRLLLFLIAYSLILYLILLTLIFYPDNERYLIPGTFYLLCINLPCFLCIASIKDIDILKRIMLYLSYLIFALGIIYLSLIWIGKITFLSYSMTFSYYLLIPAIVFAGQKKKLFTFIFIIICIMMIMIGSRGALVAAVVYAFLLLFIDRKSRKNILLATTVMVIIIVSGSFLSLFLKLSDNMAVTSRTMNLFLEGDFTQGSSRSDLYSTIWNSILNNPVWGYGIFGDRILLDGTWSHNFFLEIFHNFGLFFGSVLIMFLSYLTILALVNSDIDGKKFLLMFFCFGFFPLMVSGSYLIQNGFGLFIGSLFLLRNNLRNESI
jgi:O-Antigen ligase